MIGVKEIISNCSSVKERILIASRNSRYHQDVKLIAVTKHFGVEAVLAAFKAGQRDFGENYVQEAEAKKRALEERLSKQEFSEIRFHYIGHLQRNKAKPAASIFDAVHSVSKVELANQLDKYCGNYGRCLDVLVQVNISGESSKAGVRPSDTARLCACILEMENLKLKGLMAIGSRPGGQPDAEKARKEFCSVRELKKSVELELGCVLPDLSMGMSGDFELAIEEGSTIVRVGTAIFGSRGNQ